MITEGASVDDIKEYAVNSMGMKTLRTSALELVKDGTTTVAEMARISYYE